MIWTANRAFTDSQGGVSGNLPEPLLRHPPVHLTVCTTRRWTACIHRQRALPSPSFGLVAEGGSLAFATFSTVASRRPYRGSSSSRPGGVDAARKACGVARDARGASPGAGHSVDCSTDEPRRTVRNHL